MRKLSEPELRTTLRLHTDGLTLVELADKTGLSYRNVHRAIDKMPDAYIDRWIRPDKFQRYQAVWCVVVPPENCPHPKEPNE